MLKRYFLLSKTISAKRFQFLILFLAVSREPYVWEQWRQGSEFLCFLALNRLADLGIVFLQIYCHRYVSASYQSAFTSNHLTLKLSCIWRQLLFVYIYVDCNSSLSFAFRFSLFFRLMCHARKITKLSFGFSNKLSFA